MSEIIRAFLDDTSQILGPKFSFGELPETRSEREREIAAFVMKKAEIIYNEAKKIGGVKYMNPFEAMLHNHIYKTRYSKNEEGESRAVIPTEYPPETGYEEMLLRELIVSFGKKLVEENLVQGTWGNISVRLGKREILVTPSGIDYDRITPQAIVKIDIHNERYEGELKPTSEKNLHLECYKRRSDINAIIHTHSTYACVFACANKDMEYDGINVSCGKYAVPGSRKVAKNTAAALGNGIGAFMANHGMIAVGSDLGEAFRNAVLIEEKAKECLDSLQPL